MRWDDVGAWGSLGVFSGGKVPGKLPHIPQPKSSYPVILEGANRRVPASDRLLPPLVRIAAVVIGVWILSLGNKMVLGLAWPIAIM